MDIIKFTNPGFDTLLEQGEIVNGLKSKMWVERYRDISDFEFTANSESMPHLVLPVGTLISHTDIVGSHDC